MDSAMWCRTPAAASAGSRLRPAASKNSSTALSSNDGELARSITTCAPATASLTPSPVMVLTPLLREAATTSWPPWRRMATVFEPIRPLPPITTIFMGYPACRRFKAATVAKNLRGFPHRRRHRGGRLGSTELCNAQGIRGSCGGNVSIERRRRDAEVTRCRDCEPCLGGFDVIPTETRRLVLGSDHNEGMSRHSDLMIARALLRWLGEVRQMSAIGTHRR